MLLPFKEMFDVDLDSRSKEILQYWEELAIKNMQRIKKPIVYNNKNFQFNLMIKEIKNLHCFNESKNNTMRKRDSYVLWRIKKSNLTT